MLLTQVEIHELTGYVRPTAQIRALKSMRIPHRVRPDGRPIVVESDISAAKIGGAANDAGRPQVGDPWSGKKNG